MSVICGIVSCLGMQHASCTRRYFVEGILFSLAKCVRHSFFGKKILSLMVVQHSVN